MAGDGDGPDMLRELSKGVVRVDGRPIVPEDRHKIAKEIGIKAAGLSLFPEPWTPPFIAVTVSVYRHWSDLPEDQRLGYLENVAEGVASRARDWSENWTRGIYIRSSATSETLDDRGTYNSLELAADFDGPMIARSFTQIFTDFAGRDEPGEMAIVVQARAACVATGHISNEPRVSKTANQWAVEFEKPDNAPRRFNSQRDQPPDPTTEIAKPHLRIAQLPKFFRKVGRWATGLGVGRSHIEWGLSAGDLWLFQIDFEADQPDTGLNPNELLRDCDFTPVGDLPQKSPFAFADLSSELGWRKIDKVRGLRDPSALPYPSLLYITGDTFSRAVEAGYDLEADLKRFASARLVCRTDCNSDRIGRLNLPRTDTVAPAQAVDFMKSTLNDIIGHGVAPSDVCFILHKFIPSVTAAWAVARTDDNVVRVDSLWGLPDGLQYLPHDSFEYDVGRKRQSTERITYKPAFLQETASGEWSVSKVARRFARTRSLPAADLAYVAEHTKNVASKTGEDVQIMWFCRVPEETGLPSNIPWFAMKPHSLLKRESQISPAKTRFPVHSFADLEQAETIPQGGCVLLIDPDDPELFRSNEFLDRIKAVASDRNFPVAITGSILGHAFYVLEKAELAVIPLSEPTRSRVRQKQVFNKIVRDEIPRRISEGGETVTLAEISTEEARAALVGKLFEESFELLAADAPSDVTAELADMLEVIQSLAHATGVDWRDVVSVAADKKEQRGGFERNVVLLETATPGWIETAAQAPNMRIPLRKLNSVTEDGATLTVPFSVLLGSGSPVPVQLSDGSRMRLALGSNGFSLTPMEQNEDQLSFPLQ